MSEYGHFPPHLLVWHDSNLVWEHLKCSCHVRKGSKVSFGDWITGSGSAVGLLKGSEEEEEETTWNRCQSWAFSGPSNYWNRPTAAVLFFFFFFCVLWQTAVPDTCKQPPTVPEELRHVSKGDESEEKIRCNPLVSLAMHIFNNWYYINWILTNSDIFYLTGLNWTVSLKCLERIVKWCYINKTESASTEQVCVNTASPEYYLIWRHRRHKQPRSFPCGHHGTPS